MPIDVWNPGLIEKSLKGFNGELPAVRRSGNIKGFFPLHHLTVKPGLAKRLGGTSEYGGSLFKIVGS